MFFTQYFLALYAASAVSIVIIILTKEEDDNGNANVGWPGKFIAMLVLGLTIQSVTYQACYILFHNHVAWPILFFISVVAGYLGVYALTNGISYLRFLRSKKQKS